MADRGRIDRDGAVVAAHAGFGSAFYFGICIDAGAIVLLAARAYKLLSAGIGVEGCVERSSVSRPAQYVGWACGMQTRLFPEHNSKTA